MSVGGSVGDWVGGAAARGNRYYSKWIRALVAGDPSSRHWQWRMRSWWEIAHDCEDFRREYQELQVELIELLTDPAQVRRRDALEKEIEAKIRRESVWEQVPEEDWPTGSVGPLPDASYHWRLAGWKWSEAAGHWLNGDPKKAEEAENEARQSEEKARHYEVDAGIEDYVEPLPLVID